MQADPSLRSAALADLTLRAYQFSVRGEFSPAESLCTMVERLAKIDHNEFAFARSKNVHGEVLRDYGEYREALAAFDEALSYFDQHPENRGIVIAYQGKGIVYLSKGDFVRALENFQRALSMAEAAKYREGIIPALNSLGEVYREQGQPERALEFYERARRATADDSAWNMAFIFNNIGMSHEAMGNRAKAIEFIGKSRAVAEKHNMRPRVATSLAVLANINLDERHFEEARKQYEESLALSRELRDQSSEGRALLGLAETARRRGDFSHGLSYAQEAIAVFKKTGEPDRLVSALTCAGRCYRARKDDANGRTALEQAITAVEKMRGQIVGGEEESVAFFETRVVPYEEMISLDVAGGQPEEALLMTERASARALLDVVSRDSSVLLADVLTKPEAARARELGRRIADSNRELSRVQATEQLDEERIASLQHDLENARNARSDFDGQIAAAHPEVKRATSLDLFRSVSDFAPLTDSGETTLLKFAVTDHRCYLFALRRGHRTGQVHLDLATIDIERADVEKRVKAFRTALAERTLAWQKPAHELYDLLLQPAEKFWKGTTRLILVPDGPLWELPFQALLNTNNRPLLEDFTVSYAPSLSVLVHEQAESKTATTATDLLIFANPTVAEKSVGPDAAFGALVPSIWEPLPEMEKQARELEHLYHDRTARVFIGDDAREEVARREMPQAHIIQFATHGVLNNRSPLYSYLLLSQRNEPGGEDGMLEAWELMHLKLHARLAVLCGCETARGRIGAGEGVLGLSWSFFVAGCPATIVSQWKVDSASAQPLMAGLHRQLLAGASTAEALRSTALELRKNERYRHPFYWAPFVLIGDPR